MKQKLLNILRKWPKDYITSLEVTIILNSSYHSIHSLLNRCVREDYLIRLKNDLYLISTKIKESRPNSFEIASILYGPSYISFESALSHHGWIPEAAYSTSSAAAKKTNSFETPIGFFSYYHIPVEIFHIGISSLKINSSNIFIADPWKALADFIYIKKRTWKNVFALCNDLRIEMENIQYSNHDLLFYLTENYPNNRTRKTLKILSKDLNL